jgi:Undecaprenyl-phosphate galactose phosphotransferase WbaP
MSAPPISVPYLDEVPARWAAGAAPKVNPVLTSSCLVATDLLAIGGALLLGIALWQMVNPGVTSQNYPDVWAVAGLMIAVYHLFGLYSPVALNPAEELRKTVQGSLLVCLVIAAGIFLSKDIAVMSRGVYVTSGVLTCLLVPICRAATRRLFGRRRWWGVPVILLGAGTTARELIASLREQPGFGMKPVACLDDNPAKLGACCGVPVVGPLSAAAETADAFRARHAVIAMPELSRERLVRVLGENAAVFRNVIVIPNLFGMASLWVTACELGGVLGLEVRQNLLAPVNRWLKRALDLACASLLGVAGSPLLLVAAAWIKLVSPGPVFYTQEREGEGGRRIRVRKLRTMHARAEQMLTRYLEDSAEARLEWEMFCKLRNDPRIVPGIGRLLRRSSLDELPQVWSVLRGDMSMVGPRPFPRYHLDRFDPEFQGLRAKVKPGLTGLWQVSARNDGDLNTQKALDTYYIRNWSLWLDLLILARTAKAVVLAKGAY